MSDTMPVADHHLAANILEALESKLAYIPGGRDREKRPFIVIEVPDGNISLNSRTNLESLIQYLLSIFSEETKGNGLTLVVDARLASWRISRTYIRLASLLLGSNAASVIAVRPDGFWDKRVDNCTRSHKEGEPTYVPLSRLCMYIEPNQLTYDLGGLKAYDHAEWIKNRLNVEEYKNEALKLITRMSELREKLSSTEGLRSKESEENLASYWKLNTELLVFSKQILQSGRNLGSSMSRESAQDVLDTVQGIHKLLDLIEQGQVEIEKAWSEMERNIDMIKDIENLEVGVARVTNWILGPADAMLNAQCQIGFDISSSEELRRQHENLELECRDAYGRYAELLHKIDSIPDTSFSDDLKSQKDFMDFVCRSFATRLERRRNVLITSQRFFRLVSEYFDKTSEVFDKLIMGSRTCNFSHAGAKLLKLERSQNRLEALERELVKEGEKLSDILSMPVKDALCRDVKIDYGEDINNIKDILDATSARKDIFNDSVELQKLTLKQIALVHTYESDAEQAVRWLNDLFDVLVDNHVEIGCSMSEIQLQKEAHQSFQDTARGTYDYGCQLVNGARVLRISCRLDLQSNTKLISRLRQVWRKLRSIGEEQLTRLRVCAVFHRNVEDHCGKLQELVDRVSSYSPKRRKSPSPELDPSCSKTEIRDVLTKRENLLPEVGRMVRLGRLLRTRLRDPLAHQRMSETDGSPDYGNQSAVESISARLIEVTRLAEKLDLKLCEAGAQRQGLHSNDEKNSGDEESSKDANVGTSNFGNDPMNALKDKLQEEHNVKSTDTSDHDPVEDSNADEYVTATECSTTPVPRSRSASFLSSEYEDAPVSTTCRITEDQISRKNEVFSSSKPETANVSTNSEDVKVVEHKPDEATVMQRAIMEKSGVVVKEVTETTTLRVSQDTRMGVSSYKLVSNTFHNEHEDIDIKEIEDLKRTLLVDDSDTMNDSEIQTYREEHALVSPNSYIGYHKSVATNGIDNQFSKVSLKEVEEQIEEPEQQYLIQIEKEPDEMSEEGMEFISKVKTVSESNAEETLEVATSAEIMTASSACRRR